MAAPHDNEIHHLKPVSDQVRLGQIVDTFANIIEFLDDDASCFFALALLMNDLTNLARPVDPAQMFRDLNNFFLNVPCEDGGPMASAVLPGVDVIDVTTLPAGGG